MNRLFDSITSEHPIRNGHPTNGEEQIFPTITPVLWNPLREHNFGENYGSSEPAAFRRQSTSSMNRRLQEQVFGVICGRLGSIGEPKKYSITVGEVSRRVQAPENLNSSILCGIMRFGKKKENSDLLRNDLSKYGLNLELGKRKTNRANVFTPLCEGEARDLAENFTDLCLGYGGADCIGRAYAAELLKEGERDEEVLKMIVGVKKFLSFLTKIHHSEALPSDLPKRTLVDEAVCNLSLRTHGFSHVAISGVAEYMNQMLESATKTLWRHDNGAESVPAAVTRSYPPRVQAQSMFGQSPILAQFSAVSPNLMIRTTSQILPGQTPVLSTSSSRHPSTFTATRPFPRSNSTPDDNSYQSKVFPGNSEQNLTGFDVSSILSGHTTVQTQETPTLVKTTSSLNPMSSPSTIPDSKPSVGFLSPPDTVSSQLTNFPRTFFIANNSQSTFQSNRYPPMSRKPSTVVETRRTSQLYSTDDFLNSTTSSTLEVKSSVTGYATKSSLTIPKSLLSPVNIYTPRKIKQEPIFEEDEDTRDSGCAGMEEEYDDDENESNPFLQTDFSMF